ncbi:MAG: hypothetical protein F6J87_14630 [Spirulina sp. SIO3F2]|nr:hypothetical protein [Spirulina sp. SIO3F2]
MEKLRDQGFACQETYGNNVNGDIQLLDDTDVSGVQTWILSQYQMFNPKDASLQPQPSRAPSEPHLEIKTSYLCGQEAEWIVRKETIIAVVSASRISRPSQKKFIEAGITFLANVPRSEFS